MELSEATARLRDDLRAAAALGDEKTIAIADALAGAVETSAQLMLLSALSTFAGEVSDALGDRTVHVELHGTEAVVDVRHKEKEKSEADPAADDSGEHPTFEELTGDISRVTLRLVEQMKAKAEEAAAQSGVSLNSWVSQAVQGALRDQWGSMGGGMGGGKNGPTWR
ncbi:toxin-antitoxin system HicB family antitoxin [Antrihabitans sp. YC3-6]|uniref:Toxin-antitoxin system HicB family antitoxin n=1 Tax=Antrihabitans stalagmiti TaxID=2799499 RepID=A0A934NTW6_9NOCA|nr:toxin-antitoxin system HicB family antitoxin [Antrihabitans stalagmiti]MBJ8341488.1 toxin-antitoxin system HicB family antitoxin [Antrihabitans stalagmiti]